jgi:chitodextrinase
MLQLLHLSQSLNKFLSKLAQLQWFQDFASVTVYLYTSLSPKSLQLAHLHPVWKEIGFLKPMCLCKNAFLYFITVFFITQFISIPTAFASTLHPFTAHMMVGGDDTPPTVPAPFGATAVSHNQIDLVWGASTDDTALAGYRVFRDAVQIATTTLTTFSDIGLNPDTAYTYNVDAFDIFFNYSSSSDFATATTLVEVVPPAPATSTPSVTQGPASVILNIDSVVVFPQQFSARLEWVTNVPTTYVVRWGRTDSYELGSVYGGQFLFEHSTIITDLEIATRYFYEIEAVQGMGVRRVFRGEFITSGTIPAAAVANVLGLRAIVQDDSVLLKWRNPNWPDFSHVRIVRSHLFYPQNVTDGKVVYEGVGESYYDKDAFLERSRWYYAIFVYDKNGRISSGATVMVLKEGGEIFDQEIGDREFTTVDLLAMDVALSQGKTTSYLHDPAVFSPLEPLFVSIPLSAVPKHLKSIIVTITHPSRHNESSSYLLKINPEGTAYETLIPPTLEAGQSRLTVRLYNYELATVRTVSNSISFAMESRLPPLPWWIKALIPNALLLGLLLIALTLILTRWWLVWREREDN